MPGHYTVNHTYFIESSKYREKKNTFRTSLKFQPKICKTLFCQCRIVYFNTRPIRQRTCFKQYKHFKTFLMSICFIRSSSKCLRLRYMNIRTNHLHNTFVRAVQNGSILTIVNKKNDIT